MTNDAKILIERAQKLSVSEREDVLEAILLSLRNETSSEVDQAWRDAIDARLAEISATTESTVDFDSAVGELRSK